MAEARTSVRKFEDEMRGQMNRCVMEFDLTYNDVTGVLEGLKHDVLHAWIDRGGRRDEDDNEQYLGIKIK